MTARRLLIAIPLVALLVAPVVLFLVDRANLVYPTPDTETEFLRAYTPNRVLDRFRSSKYSSWEASSGPDAAGLGFATHKRSFDQQLVMRTSQLAPLMAALSQDAISSLAATGAQVISQTGNDTGGVRLHYFAGKSTGTVTIKPPDPNADSARHPPLHLCPGDVDVRVHIAIEETWFKSGSPMSSEKQKLLSRLLM